MNLANKNFERSVDALLIGCSENENSIISGALAINLVTLTGGEQAFLAQYNDIADQGSHHRDWVGDKVTQDARMKFFADNEAEVMKSIAVIHSHDLVGSFLAYLYQSMGGVLELDEIAKGLYECQKCNETPSHERTLVCGWMVYKCLQQLCGSFQWLQENQ